MKGFFLTKNEIIIQLIHSDPIPNDGMNALTFLSVGYYVIKIYKIEFDEKNNYWYRSTYYTLLDTAKPSLRNYNVEYQNTYYSRAYSDGLSYIEKGQPVYLHFQRNVKKIKDWKFIAIKLEKIETKYDESFKNFKPNTEQMECIKEKEKKQLTLNQLIRPHGIWEKIRSKSKKTPTRPPIVLYRFKNYAEFQLKFNSNSDSEIEWINKKKNYLKLMDEQRGYLKKQLQSETDPHRKSFLYDYIEKLGPQKETPSPDMGELSDEVQEIKSIMKEHDEKEANRHEETQKLISEYGTILENELLKFESQFEKMESFLIDRLGISDFDKLKNSWQQYKEGKIPLKSFIGEGVKILGKKFAERILDKIF